MIDRLKYATINDIGIKTLYFFEDREEKERLQFCQENSISYLPSSDRKSLHKLVDNKFIKLTLEDEKHLCVNPYDLIFKKETLDKFEAVNSNEIRFIIEDDKIKGVVHIVDYNTEFIYIELYKLLYRFENNLRDLLIKKGKTNEDFINWVELKKISEMQLKEESKKHYTKRYNQLIPSNEKDRLKEERIRKECNPFQTFYLRELVAFTIKQKYISKKEFNESYIGDLRNWVAHSKDFANTEDKGVEKVYNFKGLTEFVNKINKFLVSYEKLEEELAKMK